MSDAERQLEHGREHRVTPLELIFDLVFAMLGSMGGPQEIRADRPAKGYATGL